MKRNHDESSNLIAAAAILHIVVILIAYSSPWWLDWRVVAIGVLAYYLQILIFKGLRAQPRPVQRGKEELS